MVKRKHKQTVKNEKHLTKRQKTTVMNTTGKEYKSRKW